MLFRSRIDREGSVMRTEVIDQGRGVPAEVAARIFERFDRGRANQDSLGHGMGLYISRSLIEAHGGKIWVKRANQTGSIFAFELVAKDAE